MALVFMTLIRAVGAREFDTTHALLDETADEVLAWVKQL